MRSGNFALQQNILKNSSSYIQKFGAIHRASS